MTTDDDGWRGRLAVATVGCSCCRDVLVSVLGGEAARPDRELIELLADVAALVLYDEAEEPLRPVYPGASRSVHALSDDDLDRLKAEAAGLPLDLRARVRDVLWIRRRGGEHEAARVAVRDYCEVAVQLALASPSTWDTPRSRVARALALSRMLNFADGIAAARTALVRLIEEDVRSDVRLHAAELLGRFGADDSRTAADVAVEIAETAVGRIADTPVDWDWHRYAFEVAADCRAKAGDAEGARALRVRGAQLWVAQERWLGARGVAAATRAFVIESGMVAMRDLGVTGSAIDEVHARFREVQAEMAGETKTVRGPAFGAAAVANHAMTAVRDRPFREAVLALIGLCPITTLAELREIAEKSIRDAPLAHLFTYRRIDGTGRTVAAREGVDLSDPGADAMRTTMAQSAAAQQSAYASVVIESARRVIAAQHPGAIADWAQLLLGRPLVPPSRVWTIAHGLSAGLHGDTIASTAILAPQIEHFARRIVASAGGVTTDFDVGTRVQEEAPLGSLLRRPELLAAIGEDLAFDLRVLLDDRYGANLRNNVAHGLWDDSDFMGPHAIYLWFSVLRLVMLVGPPGETG